MKGILMGLILSMSTLASARIFYVQDRAYNENASDTNPGTDINYPFATWQKGFNTAMPGDTVYFRGGTWYPRNDDFGNVTIYYPSSGYGHRGTKSKPVCFFAYPPDVEAGFMPVLDCRHTHPNTENHVGLYISTSGYAHFKGLQVTNVRSWPRASGEMWCAGIMADGFRHLTLEHMSASYVGGAGFFLMNHDTLYLINCDSHHNCDSLDVELPGNDADGFTLGDSSPVSDSFRISYISGCRAWNNSDDGFNITTRKQLIMHDCWAWNNGDLEGDANGYKMSLSHVKTSWKRLIYNCIAAYNESAGFIDLNLNQNIGPFYEYLNNTSYRCGVGFGSSKGQVFDCSRDPASVISRNNISYASTGPYPATYKACDYGFPTYVIQDHNTWVQTGEYFHTEPNPAYAVSASDFISLDSAQLRWPRKVDGSLPDITFLKLRSGSDLINGGVDVGLAYYGPAPDLGAFQEGPFSVEIFTPQPLDEFHLGDPVSMQAKVSGLPEDIREVTFYSENGQSILGTGAQLSPSVWQFTWVPDAVGYQGLRAVATGSQGMTATSALVRVRIRWTLGAEDSTENNTLGKIIPNPNNGFFLLELQKPLNQSCDVFIFSMNGQLMAVERMAQDEKVKEINVSSLPPGLYSIQVGNGEDPMFQAKSLKMVIH